jgi:hypothetical protein
MTECERDRNKDQLKHSWGRWEYTTCCTLKEKSGIAWFHLRIWKLKGGKGKEGGGQMPPMCRGGKRTTFFVDMP